LTFPFKHCSVLVTLHLLLVQGVSYSEREAYISGHPAYFKLQLCCHSAMPSHFSGSDFALSSTRAHIMIPELQCVGLAGLLRFLIG
jgi:hypothetical protein